MQKIPLKDLPLLPRQQLITDKATQSVCVQVLAEANSPLVMSYTGADPGTGVVTFKLNRVNPVAKTYQYPKKMVVNQWGFITEVEEGTAPSSVHWDNIDGKPTSFVSEAQITQSINNWFSTNKVSWTSLSNVPTTFKPDTSEVRTIVANWWIDAKKTASWNDLTDKPVIKSLTWTNLEGKPTNLTDFGVKSEVQQMLDTALQNFSPSGGSGATSGTPPVSFFTSPMACVDDGVVYATIFSRKTRLNLGGNKFARALKAPTANTEVAVYKNSTTVCTIKFDTNGVGLFSASGFVDYEIGDLLTAKFSGASNQIGNVTVTIETGIAEATIPPAPTDVVPNNTQHTLNTINSNYVWLYTPTSNSTYQVSESKAYALVAPTATAVFNVTHNGVNVGTLTFAPGANIGLFQGADRTVQRGDILGIVAVDASTIAGLLINVVVDASVNDELNLVASSASAVVASEVYRHAVAHPFNINVSASSFVAAQVDSSRPTGFNVRKNGTVVGSVVFPAGSNDGVLTMQTNSFAVGDIFTLDAQASSSLAGYSLNFSCDVTGTQVVKEFSASYVGEAPELQLLNGLYLKYSATLDFVNAQAKLSAPATEPFVVAIHKNAVEIATITFASGTTVGRISASSNTVAANATDRICAYAKSGIARRPAITIPLN